MSERFSPRVSFMVLTFDFDVFDKFRFKFCNCRLILSKILLDSLLKKLIDFKSLSRISKGLNKDFVLSIGCRCGLIK